MTLVSLVSNSHKILEKPLQSTTPIVADGLEPEEIVTVIKELIGWYQRRRSTQLALLIKQHIEMLLIHPEVENLDTATFCQHHKLQKRWGYLC